MTRTVRTRAIIVAAALVAGFVVLTLLDGRIYRAIDPSLASREWLDTQLWYLVLRHTGSLWTWLVVGVGLIALDLYRRSKPRATPTPLAAWRRGVFVACSAGAAGLAAELLKLVIARERPATIRALDDGTEALVYQGYQFRGLFAGFVDGSNLGLPSSHAATAAGGAFAIALLAPRVGLLAVALAVGCGISRLLTGAHFATDVYAGLAVGLILSGVLGRAFGVGPAPHTAPGDADS
jgi:membrane-associated phospholipid phosphatase